MTIKELTQKFKDSKELLVTAGGVIAVIIGGYFWFQDTLYERELAIIEKHSELLSDQLIEKITEKINPVSTEDFNRVLDTVIQNQYAHAYANEAMHLRTLRRVDTTLILLEERELFDAQLELRIEAIQSTLDSIRGISVATREEQAEQAFTDSLQNELMRIKMEKLYRDRMRQSEEQHKEELRKIRDLSKDVVIDKGRTKKVRTGRKRGQKRDWDFDL